MPEADKEIAYSLSNVLEHPCMVELLNPYAWVQDRLVNKVLSFWKYDLYTRKPGPIYKNGNQYITLDLSTFMFELVNRNAYIELPEYDPRYPIKKTKNEIKLNVNKQGECLSLTSNKMTFNFGIRIKDLSLIRKQKNYNELGSYRTYLLTDYHGLLYDGWKGFNFNPTDEENNFLINKELWNDDELNFDYFINQEKWISFYGHHYFITKALIIKLKEDRSLLKKVIQECRNNKISCAKSESESFEWPNQEPNSNYETIKILSFETEIDCPFEKPDRVNIPLSSYYMLKCFKRIKLINKYLEKLRFLTRSVEYAFSQKHDIINIEKNQFLYPSWIKKEWKSGFKLPKKRVSWYMLEYNDLTRIRFRWSKKSYNIKK